MSNTPYQPVFTNTNPYASNNDAPRDTQYYTPETEHLQLHDDHLPPGAAAPRFMGSAAQENRTSFASSRPTLQGDEYAMNEANKPGFYGLDYNDSDLNASQANFPKESYGSSPYLGEKSAYPAKKSRKKAILIGAAAVAAVIAAVVIAVYFAVIKPKSDNNSTSGNTSSGDSSSDSDKGSSSGGAKTNLVVTGGDGSTVTMDDGTTFTYQNSFGGTWYYDPANPLTSGARAQSWTPALNETFKFGEDIIRGYVMLMRPVYPSLGSLLGSVLMSVVG